MPNTKPDNSPHETPSLGQELRRLRQLHGFTLKDVERTTGISNAYLSQVETGKIEKPSPAKLYALAEMYKVSYDKLMETAGHITRQSTEPRPSLAGTAFSSLGDLTPAEMDALATYLTVMRMKKNDAG
ncbi:helix-turn-helix domain-containing protein [Deinococcus antarcticus]|uniref:Helix-turn-helix domain-containing protein n=1 Tax=Deinococcus antarcticus TaxID=1298767 RepID=A0ABV8A6Y6_9DEIO